MNKKPIGILGGTFDPIHFGHLRMGLELHHACQLDRIEIVPAAQPVHRDQPVASPEDRLAMIELAIANEPAFQANICEIERGTLSYTVDTLRGMHELLPTTPLCLLVGIDAFLDFLQWKHPFEILQLAHIIVAHRPNYQLPPSGPLVDLIKMRAPSSISYIHQNLSGAILLRPITALEISSTDIRQQCIAGDNPRYLLPDNVYNYIKQHQIYT